MLAERVARPHGLRIAASRLGVPYAELAEATGDDGGGKVAQMRLKRLDAAHKRFLAATKALAVTRRLTAGLRIEINHTHGSTADVREGTGPAGRMRAVGEEPVDGTPLADRLRGLMRENVGSEAALAAGAGV